jgi:hypothetical protein
MEWLRSLRRITPPCLKGDGSKLLQNVENNNLANQHRNPEGMNS